MATSDATCARADVIYCCVHTIHYRTENLDLVTNAEIRQTIRDLKTFGAVPNNKIVLDGDYEVGIIDDEISIKMAEKKVLKKVVSENTQKVSYYTSNGKGKKKEQKLEITPRPGEVKINRKSMIYVPEWIITIKAGEHIYNRKALAASNTLTVDQIAICPNHFIRKNMSEMEHTQANTSRMRNMWWCFL